MEPTQSLPHPGHWVLAGLHVMSFNIGVDVVTAVTQLKNFVEFFIIFSIIGSATKEVAKVPLKWQGGGGS